MPWSMCSRALAKKSDDRAGLAVGLDTLPHKEEFHDRSGEDWC